MFVASIIAKIIKNKVNSKGSKLDPCGKPAIAK